jgi:hypothetical protein
MLSRNLLVLAVAALATVSLATPIESIAMGSKHNLYLVTCTQRNILDCPLLILCSKDATAVTKYTAMAYYANGPIPSNRISNSKPTQTVIISRFAQLWEGTQRVGKLGQSGSVSSNIDAQAASLAKGQISGTAQMDNEEFVCFRDGQTKIQWSEDLGVVEVDCTTDYWCPSIQV